MEEKIKELEAKISITNDLLSRFPAYGEFDLILIPKPIIITNIQEAKEIVKTWEQTTAEGLQAIERFKKEQEIVQELIFGGFVINRHDIKVEGKVYRQLTDKGRELKELGSMDAYNRVQQAKSDAIRDSANRQAKADQRDIYSFWVTVSLAISTGVAALYYLKELWVYFFEY